MKPYPGRRSAVSYTVALALTLSGCGSSPSAFYTLAPVPGPVVVGGPASLEVRHIGLAGYLDRDEIVRSSASYRIDVLEFAR
ncbi:MAG: membrane integrity-associated transporter subunit PqiC, partial [Acidisphaera sp.]|nr:membrane integrity-associated transporter subunit PqiC [Acidisphaera sp.]